MIYTMSKDIFMKNWYKRFYLCYEETNPINYPLIIEGFKCYQFPSYELADKYYDENYNLRKNMSNKRNIIISVCIFVPSFLDKYIINWKLKNIYWKGNIRIL